MGVADWETQLVEKLPDALKGSLLSIEEIHTRVTVRSPLWATTRRQNVELSRPVVPP
jgi:hypothetical protein